MTVTNTTSSDNFEFIKYYREVAMTTHYNLKGKKQSVPETIKKAFCAIRTRYEFFKSLGNDHFDNQDVLAEMSGMARPTFSTATTALKEMGLIRIVVHKTKLGTSNQYAWVASPKQFRLACEESVQLGVFKKQLEKAPVTIADDVLDITPDEDVQDIEPEAPKPKEELGDYEKSLLDKYRDRILDELPHTYTDKQVIAKCKYWDKQSQNSDDDEEDDSW